MGNSRDSKLRFKVTANHEVRNVVMITAQRII